MRHLLYPLLVLLVVRTAFSQESQPRVYPLPEVVTTATKTPVSPGNVTQKIDILADSLLSGVITPNRNIAQVLASLPGNAVTVLSRNDANWGTYGGIGPKYSTYMVQGLPVDAFVDPMALDLLAVARIEVQRGPASVLYPNYLSQDFAGNQSPLAGTVNLLMKEYVASQATTVSTAYGSFNTFTGQIYHQDHAKNLHYFAGTTYESSDYADYGAADSWLNMRKNPEYRKMKIFGGVALYSGKDNQNKATIFANTTSHTGDAGRVYRGFDNDYDLLNAGYSAALTDHVVLQAHAGIRTYDRSWQESLFGAIDTLKSNNGVLQHVVPADLSLSFTHGEGSILTAGIDYQVADYATWTDPLAGYHLYGNKSKAHQTGVYAQEELHAGALTLRGGLRYARTSEMIELIDGNAPGSPTMAWNRVLWSAGMKFRPAEGISVYANGGSSFTAPGLKSIGGTIRWEDRGAAGRNGQLPNPGLKPESGLGLDAGVDAVLPGGFVVGMRGFLTRVSDAIIDIAVSAVPSQSQSINAGNSSSIGSELCVSQNLCDGVCWFANASLMKTSIDNSYIPDQDGTAIPFAPDLVANIGADISLASGFQFHPWLSYGGTYYDSNSKSGRSAFKQGITVNMSASYRIISTSDLRVEAFAQVNNITDNRFLMPWGFQDIGLCGTGGVKVTI